MKKLMILCAMLLVFGVSGTAIAAPIQWKIADGGNDHWYDRVDTAMTWHNAKTYAEGLGGYLATIFSQDENNFIYNNLYVGQSTSAVWLGGTDEAQEGVWNWVTGETFWNNGTCLLYCNWNLIQPDNHSGVQDYLVFGEPLGGWDDQGRSFELYRPFFIEYDTIPIPEDKDCFNSGNIISDYFDAASSVYAADIDGEGNVDVLGTASTAGDISWWKNENGDGTQWTEYLLDGNFAGALDVFAADLDNDGDLDILGAAHMANEISWWENPKIPHGTETDVTTWTKHVVATGFLRANKVIAAYLDGDEYLDIIASGHDNNGIYWWKNVDGQGTFGPKNPVRAGINTTGLGVADIDKDGHLDVIGNDRNTQSTFWWRNSNGDGSVWTERLVGNISANAIYVEDIDGDGFKDVVGAAWDADKIIWWKNTNGDGTLWTEYVVSGNFIDANSVHAADIDGNGDLDILGTAATDDDITWWENTSGDGTVWTEHTVEGNFDYAADVYAADINGNGALDILGAAHFADDITWWENQCIPNSPPVANAGSDQSTHVGDLVTLDGSSSYDPDENYPLNYAWEIVSQPEGCTAGLSGADLVNPTFPANCFGDYLIQLVVFDSEGLSSEADSVTISTFNTAPVADASLVSTVV